VRQLVALQLVQELPLPARGVVSPLSPLEKAAQAETVRWASLWQRGQGAFSSALLSGRNSSNLKLQSEQRYS